MTRLLALLLALLVPSANNPMQGLSLRRVTRQRNARKPNADILAEEIFDGAVRAGRWISDAISAGVGTAQAWTASLFDSDFVRPSIAPALAISVARRAPAPATLAEAVRAIASTANRITDEIEMRFVERWDEPVHARMAARLFSGSVAMVCVGIVGVVAVSAPAPALPIGRLASAVGVPIEVAAVTDVATAQTAAAGEQTTAGAEQAKASTGQKAAKAAPVPPTTAPPPPPIPPAARGALPIGKGMWIWMEGRADGGDPNAIVARAKAMGLTHLYVRTGTLKGGFSGGPFLDALLPVAHANGIRVYGWDFPYLNHPEQDVNRAVAAIRYTTPDGHRIDGFSADIESTNEGTNGNIEFINAYGTWLRGHVGPDYPLIATVPNPTPAKVAAGYPYATVVPHFDAVAPMVYWMNRDPATDVANAVTYLSQFGKPVFPIGQAYDGAPEGGPPGVPGRDKIIRFMQSADAIGAAGVSFWSYQHATQEVWDAVRDAGEFRLHVGGPNGEDLSPAMVRAYQVNLTSLGFPVPPDGVWGPATVDAVKAYQKAARLRVTGAVDEATRAFLLTPVAAPLPAV